MISVIAPNRDFPPYRKSVFLAGTITGAKLDWQKQITESLKEFDIIVFNPRREKKPEDEAGIRDQITWEFENLRRADLISFWFSNETVGPICLYELGAHLMTNKPIVIGMHPDYPRRFDVEVQSGLIRPGVPIVYSLEALSDKISETLNFLFQI
jgi:hypothetical protein